MASKTQHAALIAAVAYVRMSSDMQDKSAEQQREQILKLAAKLGCKIVRWYQDLGISGDDIKRRVAFREMIADAATKDDFSLILCWSQDRFGRFDSLEAGEWIGPLRRRGVRLVTAAEGEINWNDAAGRLIFTIQQEAKNTFLIDLARNTTRGRYVGAQRVGCYSGPLAFGYDKLVFDERGKFQRRVTRRDRFVKPRDWSARLVRSNDSTSVNTVRWMFRDYAKGLSLRSITHRLNERKIPAPRGRYWRRTTVKNMLRNPVYTGDQVWNRLHIGKYFGIVDGEITSASAFIQEDGCRHSVRRNRQEDWVTVKNAHPALVSRELFQRVQCRLIERKGRDYQRGGLALTGLVFCGHCGASMGSRPYRQVYKNSTYFYRKLLCPTSSHAGPSVCRPRMIDEPRLLDFVVRTLTLYILDEQFENRLQVRLASEFGADNKWSPAAIKRLNDEARRLEKIIERATENLLLAGPRQVRPALAKLSTWQSKRDAVMSRLAKIEAGKMSNIQRLVADTMCVVRRLRFGLAGRDHNLLHQTLRQLVHRITLWFGPHPKKPGCSKLSKGVMTVRVPSYDSTTVEQTIDFTGLDLGDNRPGSQLGWRARPAEATVRIDALIESTSLSHVRRTANVHRARPQGWRILWTRCRRIGNWFSVWIDVPADSRILYVPRQLTLTCQSG